MTEVSVRYAIQKDPEDADAHNNLGNILFNSGKIGDSIEELTTVREDRHMDATHAARRLPSTAVRL